MSLLEECLREFGQVSEKHTFSGCPWAATFQGDRHGFHVVFAAIVHGDEVGPLPALVEMAREFSEGRRSFGGRVTFLLGNVDAARQGKRLLDHDLNRVFCSQAPECREKVRGREMMEVLRTADVFVDFHQTKEHSVRPFYSFEFDCRSYLWATISGAADYYVTRRPGVRFSPGEVCADEFVRDLGKAGLTAEMGKKGFSPQVTARVRSAMERVLSAADALQRGGRTLADLARRWQGPEVHVVGHREAFTDPSMELCAGLHNFKPVGSGEVVGTVGKAGSLRAPIAGRVLFPRYPDRDDDGKAVAPYSDELYRLVVPVEPRTWERWLREGCRG